MRVLSLYYTHKPGGFCKRLYRLLNALSKNGAEVLYLSLDHPPEELSKSVSWGKIPFPTKRRAGLLFWSSFIIWCPIYSAWRALKFKPDCYLVFNPFYSAQLLIAKLLHPAPIVLFLRSLVFRINRLTGKNAWLCALSDQIDKFGVALASRTVCMTTAMQQELIEFLGWTPKQLKILPNDLPPFCPSAAAPEIAPEKINILAAGVLDSRKNITLIIEALKLLTPEIRNKINFLVIGEGALTESLRSQAEMANLACLKFIGWRAQLEPFLGAAQLLIHPSLHEGVSNTVMEALSANIPVIASDIPEHRELLLSDELLIPPRDPALLAEKLNLIVAMPETLTRLSTLCRERAANYRFDWDLAAVTIVEGCALRSLNPKATR